MWPLRFIVFPLLSLVLWTQVETRPGMAAMLPVPEAEARAFGLKLAQSLQAGQLSPLVQALDVEGILDQVLPESDIFRDHKNTFRQIFKEGLPIHPFFRAFTNAARIEFLRTHTVLEQTRCLLRLAGPSNRVDYADLVLKQQGKAGVALANCFLFSEGEMFSERARRQFLPMLLHTDDALLEQLTNRDAEMVRNWRDIQKLEVQVERQQTAEALATYRGLPPNMQRLKHVLRLRLRAAARDGGPEFDRAINLWNGLFASNPAGLMVRLEALRAAAQHEQMLEALAELKPFTEDDPHLDLLRAEQLVLLGRPAEAGDLARAVIARAPSMPEPYLLEARLRLDQADYAGTARLLKDLFTATGVDGTDTLKRESGFAAFTTSSSYFDWTEFKRTAKPPGKVIGGITLSPVTPPSSAAGEEPPRLSGIFYNATNPTALISGTTVRQGSTIKGYTVKAISHTAVTLESATGEIRILRLQFR